MSVEDDHAGSLAHYLAQNIHPEFGYLCPSTNLRRYVRQAVKLTLAAMLVAAGTAFALSFALVRPPSGDARQQPAAAPHPGLSPLARVHEASAAGAAMMPSPAALAVASASPAASAHAQARCDDPSVAFLSHQCQPGRKSRAAHERSRRLASVPLGRADTPREAGPGQAGTARGAQAQAATSAETGMQASPDKPRKLAKTAHKHRPRRDNDDMDTVADAPPRFGPFGFFRDWPPM